MGELGTLIKFGQHEHLQQLQDTGLLYLNTPQYFWDVEDGELRGDPFDCIVTVARGPRVQFTLEGQEIVAEGEWILRMFPPELGKINIFCMYALRPLTPGTFPIDERNFLFGDHALLLLNRDEFMRRMGIALESQKIRANADLVEYVDDKYTGEIGPFRKLKRFAYQSEWRLVCSHGTGGPREISIGSIQDISVIMPSDQVNKMIKVTFEQDAASDAEECRAESD
jgi:hypothetical protein